MPSASFPEEDDPVIASYDVYFADPKADGHEATKLLVMQYPSHRPRSKPYSAARSQKPTSLRMKPETGLVEMEIPILTQEYYNPVAGEKFGQALSDSRMTQHSRSYGLAGGFSNSVTVDHNVNLDDIPHFDKQNRKSLQLQTLGGKIAVPSERDPVYMLGVLRNDELHLSHLDAVVQMRPQLHHVDAEEELNQRSSATVGHKLKSELKPGLGKLETKAIELKLKDNKEDVKDRNLNENAKLLREIQRESWQMFHWLDQDAQDSRQALETRLQTSQSSRHTQLHSSMSNDEWLEKMSAPREDGKKGLRSKLKGRDRERARRKKVENQKRLANTAVASAAEVSSADDSEGSGVSDIDVVDLAEGLGKEDIKQEPGNLAAAPEQASAVPNPVPTANSPPRRRGRPRKEATNNDQ